MIGSALTKGERVCLNKLKSASEKVLVGVLMKIRTPEEANAFLQDFLTIKERRKLRKRTWTILAAKFAMTHRLTETRVQDRIKVAYNTYLRAKGLWDKPRPGGGVQKALTVTIHDFPEIKKLFQRNGKNGTAHKNGSA